MISARINISRGVRKLQALGRNVRGTLPGVLESEGRQVSISFAKSTQPYGTGGEAKIAGEKAVSRDISRVYLTAGAVFSRLPKIGEGDARQFWKLVQLGKFDAAREILARYSSQFGNIPIGNFDGGYKHIMARSASSGRVSDSSKPGMIVVDSKKLEQYKKEKMALVGFAKSAWAACARELGSVRGLRAPRLASGERDITANWITRKSAPHSVVRHYGGSSPHLTLTSHVRYADHVLSPSARRQAIAIAYERLRKQLEIAAKWEAQQANRLAA